MLVRVISIFLILASYSFPVESDIHAVVDVLHLGEKGYYTFNDTTEYILRVTNLTSDLTKVPPRIEVECLKCDKQNPVMVVFKQKRYVISLELPVVVKLLNGNEILYNKTARTLCNNSDKGQDCSSLHANETLDSPLRHCGDRLIISLSTSNTKNVTISLHVTLVTDFILSPNEKNKTVLLTPSTPHIYLYEFPKSEENESITLRVQSKERNCMLISIQNRSCPFVDFGQIYYNGEFQTATLMGAMTVTHQKFPYGFYAVFSLFNDDIYCSTPLLKHSERSKTISISMHEALPPKYYIYAIAKALGFIIIFYVIILSVTFFVFMRKHVDVPNLENECVFDSQEASSSAAAKSHTENAPVSSLKSPATEDTISMATDSSLDETDIDVLIDYNYDKNIVRTKKVLYVSDLAMKNPTVLKKKSELYLWNLVTVAIFYGLPASQLVFSYQYNLIQSGNEDLCYYNFLCSHPWGYISDFNHFFSNIGYISLGILFIIITCRKERIHKILLSEHKYLNRRFGVPEHFGIFYSLGIALIVEGLLSACYHLCPNIHNFQFDASFMYIISTLCMIKIYQSRHPDVNANAYSTFFIMAGVIFLAICGVYLEGPFFWGVFTVLHLFSCIHVTVNIYYVGRFTYGISRAVDFFRGFSCSWNFFWPTYPTRFVLISMINICNWGLAVMAVLTEVKDASTYMLLIFLVNLMLYTTFYILMKIISKEKILIQPLIYIILAVLTWSAALYYFFRKTNSWKKTPSESRTLNMDCELFDFYDNHDIWHFISAMGLFFSFMVLLTLDDDLIFTNRCRIPVF